MIGRETDARCPRCGSTLNTNGFVLWCSFVGSQGRGPYQKACDYMATAQAESPDVSEPQSKVVES